MLGEYTHCGVGAVMGEGYSWYITIELAKLAGSIPPHQEGLVINYHPVNVKTSTEPLAADPAANMACPHLPPMSTSAHPTLEPTPAPSAPVLI
jgi:hypothetical protein